MEKGPTQEILDQYTELLRKAARPRLTIADAGAAVRENVDLVLFVTQNAPAILTGLQN
jgi:hypothetical protein